MASDDAPNGELVWDYTLSVAPPLTLTAGTPTGNPAKPRAGRAFVLSVPVRRSDTAGPLTSGGVVSCKATVGGKAVKASGRFGAGKPQCVLRVPATAKGKMLRGSLKVTFKDKTVTKAFAFRVV